MRVLQQVGDTVIVQAGEERNGYAILPEGIARRESLSPGDFILKTPMRAGATWPLGWRHRPLWLQWART